MKLCCACGSQETCLCGRGWNEAPLWPAKAPRYSIDEEVRRVSIAGPAHRSWTRCWFCKQYLVKCRCIKSAPGWKIETRAEKKREQRDYEDYLYAISLNSLAIDSFEHDVYTKKQGLGSCRPTLEEWSDIAKRVKKKCGKKK